MKWSRLLVATLALSCGGGSPTTMLGPENCDNGKDDNGDGKTDCADPKCFGSTKCKVVVERCDNGIDDDNNGQTDCLDPSCMGGDCGFGCTCQGMSRTESACTDNLDNDGDTLIDCMDPDCFYASNCPGGTGGGNGSGTGGGTTSGTGGGTTTGTGGGTTTGTGGGVAGTGGGVAGTGGGVAGTGGGVAGTGGGVAGTGGGVAGTGGGVAGTGGGAAATGLDGVACTADAQCLSGRCFLESTTGYPKGMCTNADATPCTNWPSNTGCHGGRCINNRCFAGCTGRGLSGGDACRPGYACGDVLDSNTSNNNNVCVALCANDAECAVSGAGFGCNPWSHYCEPKDRGLVKYGGGCVNPGDCESGVCFVGSGYPGGYCAGTCKGDLNNCGPNGYCQWASSFGDNIGLCGQSCSSLGGSCRSANGFHGPFEYRCYQDTIGMQMAKFCSCKDAYTPCGDDLACCSGSCGFNLPGYCDPP